MCPGWLHLWHVVKGHAAKGWLAGFPALLQIAHIEPPPPLLPLPVPPRPPPGSAPTSSAASGRGGVVPGLETGGGRRGDVSSPAPACVQSGAVRRCPASARLIGGAVPRRGEGGELFNDWGGRGYDDSVPVEVTKTAPSGVRTTRSPTWSASLSRIQLITPRGWSNMSPEGAILVPSPLKTGTNLLHPLPPQSLNWSVCCQADMD